MGVALVDTRFAIIEHTVIALCPSSSDKLLQWRTLHLVVGDGFTVVTELLDAAVQVGIGEWQSKFAALRAVAYSRYGVTSHHVVTPYALNEFLVGRYYVGRCP